MVFFAHKVVVVSIDKYCTYVQMYSYHIRKIWGENMGSWDWGKVEHGQCVTVVVDNRPYEAQISALSLEEITCTVCYEQLTCKENGSLKLHRHRTIMFDRHTGKSFPGQLQCYIELHEIYDEC